MRRLLFAGVVLALVSGCDDDVSVEPTGTAGGGSAGGASGGAGGGGAQGDGGGGTTGGAGVAAEYCDVGAASVPPDPSLSGTVVTLQGMTRQATNIVQVGSADCTEGLFAALLEHESGDRVLLESGGETIFCGCAEEQHELCPVLGEDASRNITGALSYEDTGTCNQIPCYQLDVDAVCKPSNP